ncbi:hypothetical protein HDE_03199 [Halotydeus destructor]|nr:hypothetical protein HDE_03199 [Halotydeus destructor]
MVRDIKLAKFRNKVAEKSLKNKYHYTQFGSAIVFNLTRHEIENAKMVAQAFNIILILFAGIQLTYLIFAYVAESDPFDSPEKPTINVYFIQVLLMFIALPLNHFGFVATTMESASQLLQFAISATIYVIANIAAVIYYCAIADEEVRDLFTDYVLLILYIIVVVTFNSATIAASLALRAQLLKFGFINRHDRPKDMAVEILRDSLPQMGKFMNQENARSKSDESLVAEGRLPLPPRAHSLPSQPERSRSTLLL